MPLSEFGPFETAFARGDLSVPGYLLLLHLDDKPVQVVLSRMRNAMREAGDPNKYIRRLLQDTDWRPHLVGAVAILLSDQQDLLADLWSAFDAGSWVVPQLAATAVLADRDFVQRARTRIKARCPVSMPAGMSPLDRHIASGPLNQYGRSCKALASLLAVTKHIPSQAGWVDLESRQADVESMLRNDVDHGAELAEQWLTSAVRQFGEFGEHLKPAAA